MKTNNEIEKILLNDSEYDKLVKTKIEQEFKNELTNSTKNISNVVTDIKKVPNGKLFSKSAIFEVMNKSSKTKSFVNGIQAEGFLGSNTFDRTKLLAGEISSFVSDDVYVKFVKCKI